MKKIILQKNIKKRKNINFSNDFENINNQKKIITDIYFDYNFENKKKVISEIKKKINGYKSQDIKKKRYIENDFIKYNELVEKILVSKLKCTYCFSKLFLIYNNTREPKQWTLDRIDNNLQHSNNNTLISCLECNLKRRTTNKNKFLFTKQMKIIKKF